METDYNQNELDVIVNEMLTIHLVKLKPEELQFLNRFHHEKVSQEVRDKIIKLYDAIGENGC